MKARKDTGLVPVRFLKASGPYSKGQIAGLDPVVVKKMKSSKVPQIEEVEHEKDVETIEIDDNSLAIIESPMLGGYDHTPPLGSDRLPGRNRFAEQEQSAGLKSGDLSAGARPVESRERGTFTGEDLIDGGGDAPGSEPPEPPASKPKK